MNIKLDTQGQINLALAKCYERYNQSVNSLDELDLCKENITKLRYLVQSLQRAIEFYNALVYIDHADTV